jgi:cytidylate kinase
MSYSEQIPVPVVTIDGPGGAGKGTVASAIAKALTWHLLDSGALYRIIAVAGLADGIALDDAQALVEMSEGLDIVFVDGQVHVNGADFTDAIGGSAASAGCNFCAAAGFSAAPGIGG